MMSLDSLETWEVDHNFFPECMEEGSLLNEALQHDNELSNILQIDVYLLDLDPQVPQEWVRLAKVCHVLNHGNSDPLHNNSKSTKSEPYPWLMGGDGPVFGLHQSEGIPHLRVCLEYGVSVADEWQLVRQVWDRLESQQKESNNFAFECWDLDDGQILLIEGAEALPTWVDQIGPVHCRHRCWVQGSDVCLIEPTVPSTQSHDMANLSLADALDALRTRRVSRPKRLTRCIREALESRCPPSKSWYHRTALVVPRSVLPILEQRPDLVHAACAAFVNKSSNGIKSNNHSKQNASKSTSAPDYTDWVWATHSLGRTQYAQLRSIRSAEYPTEDAIPKTFQPALVELRRIALQCRQEGTPHLRHALAVGLRIVDGLDELRRHPKTMKSLDVTTVSNNDNSTTALTLKERRVQWWCQVQTNCSVDPQWLRNAWAAGPNHANISLDPILSCALPQQHGVTSSGAVAQNTNIVPLSNPESTVTQQVDKLLRQIPAEDSVDCDHPPPPTQVDSDEWMTKILSNDGKELGQPPSACQNPMGSSGSADRERDTTSNVDGDEAEVQAVEQIIGGMESFVKGVGTVDGVSHQPTTPVLKKPVDINPRRFLSILHHTLKHDTPLPPSVSSSKRDDPYFDEDDYNMGDPDTDMLDAMANMDTELREKLAGDNETGDELLEVAANLLKSLEAGGGGPGPLQNMLREMGIDPPDVEEDGGS